MPRGDQSASSLVPGLVTQPPRAEDVVRTHFPAGTRDGLSVPVVGGVAVVALSGDPAAIDEETGRRMLAQLAWTLRQDQQVRAVQLNVGGGAITLPEGSAQGTSTPATGSTRTGSGRSRTSTPSRTAGW